MMGFSNSLSINLSQRADDLRRAAAHEAAARAARSAARRESREAAEAAQLRRAQYDAFSWETYRGERGSFFRLLGRAR